MTKIPADKVEKINQYVERIRNDKKHEYAREYMFYKLGYRDTEPERKDLSVMAAQAVIIRISEIINEK